MPADLDEMFADLGRDGDTVPVRPAADARRRGNRRRRARAVAAAAAAVVLVLAGVGVALRRHATPEPVLPADTVRGLAPIGEPVPVQGTTSVAEALGDRVYFGSGTALEVIAVDARTGEVSWRAPKIEPFLETNGPIATDRAVLIAAGSALRVHDPETGERLWQYRYPADPSDPDLVVHDDVLVEARPTGLTTGYDLLTGRKLWSVPGTGGARPLITVGHRSGAEYVPDEPNARGVRFSDDGRIVQVTVDGEVLLRDMRTGTAEKRVPTPRSAEGYESVIAYGDTVLLGVSADAITGQAIIGADLSTGASRRLWGDGERGLRKFTPCGGPMLCVADFASLSAEPELAVIDTESGQEIRRTASGSWFGDLSARGGRILNLDQNTGFTLYGAAGEVLARSEAATAGGWIDDRNVLAIEDGEIAVYSARDGARTPLAVMGDDCAWTTEFLACRTGLELRLWRFARR